jgi:hypothetical protein
MGHTPYIVTQVLGNTICWPCSLEMNLRYQQLPRKAAIDFKLLDEYPRLRVTQVIEHQVA